MDRSSRTPGQVLDELLVLACQAGGRRADEAFAGLHRRFRRRLLAHASRLLGPALADRADDVGQDAWVAIARGLPRLSAPEHFRAWAYSIVTRRVADVRRALGRDQRLAAELERATGDDAAPAAVDDAAEGERSVALGDALRRLAPEDRVLLRLFYLEELSVAETAAALAIPAGTVKSRLFHARRRLRRAMQESER